MHPLDPSIPYTAPALKTAPVFGGIAGIMTSSSATGDPNGDGEGWDTGSHMPSMSSKAQESGKLQDMYRQNLTACWAMQAGQLPPDKCIEDIFAGGDGWADHGAQPTGGRGEDSEGEKRMAGRGHHQRGSSGATLKPSSATGGYKGGSSGGSSGNLTAGVSGRTSNEQQVHASHDAKRNRRIKANEVDEFEEREDLRSWVISTPG